MDRRNRASGGVVRISRKRSLALAGAAAGAALGTIGAANAAFGSVIAQDSFNYTAGVALAGQNGGSGRAVLGESDAAAATCLDDGGVFAASATNSQPGTNATDLSYATFGGTNPTGGSVTVSAETVTAGTVGTLSRAFGSPMSTTASRHASWASVEFQGKAGVKDPNYYQLTFSDTPTNGGADPIPLPANGSQHALNLLGIKAHLR